MSDDRWLRVKALFQAAIERPADERTEFLSAETGADTELKREVESLLASDTEHDAPLDRWPLTVAHPALRAIGSYEIVAPIGAGAMGEVYEARDSKLNRRVALKILPPLLALDPDRVARFRREAQVLAALHHTHIAAIYGLEESDGVQALVLEFVGGQTLAERIAAGPVALDEAIRIASQVADALEAAHEKGIIHRDLKPANIKIAANGDVKVLDFGLAKVWEGAPHDQLAAAPTLTATRDRERGLLGTPAYMSPEQARGRALDRRTDIWSFGCVLFEMLTGGAAFGDETISDTLARVLDRDVDWQALPASTPRRLRDLLRRCLQKDVRRRLRDIGDARIELDEISNRTDAGDAEPNPSAMETGRVRWRRRLAAVAVLGLVIVATAIVSRRNLPAAPVFRQLTFRHGTVGGARLAPDGRTAIYRATWAGTEPALFLIRPESLQSGPIGLVNAGIYSVSSRGEMAVALGCRLNWGECLGTLAQVSMTGGSPRQLVKDVLAADWAPDGQSLAIVAFTGDTYQLQFPIDKALYQAKGWITDPRISPTGDRIAFLDHEQLGDTGGSVSIVDLQGRKTTLSSGWKSLHGLAWPPDGNEVWFSGSRLGKGGTSALYGVTLAGRVRTVFSSPSTLKLNDISRDGLRVLLTRGTRRGGIIGLTAGDKAERDLSWLDYSTLADLSFDGRTLLFYEWGEGVGAKSTIFVRKTDSGDAVPLGEGKPLALSPDARFVVAVQEAAMPQLVLLPTGTGDARRMPRGAIVEYLDWAAWSQDGRRIFFAAREVTNVRRTFVQDVDGGDPRPVTPDGFVGMVLSPNDKTIVAVDRYGEYYLCAVDASAPPLPLAGYRDGDVPLQWSDDGHFLFVREAGNLVLRIDTIDLDTGARRPWKEFKTPDPTVLIDIGSDPGQIRVTPDGKSYAYTYWTFEGELYLAEGLK
jgi:Tol biopolymer transport system component/aminoglycoside phosphotransferase (APT) family kinase protein